MTIKCDKNNGNIPLTRIKVPAWWLLHDTTHAFLSPLFFIKGSCFQNVQGLSLFKVNFLSLRKKYSGAFIILSEASHASHYHFTYCNLFVSNQTSVRHFSLIYFFHKSDICYVQSSTGFMLLYITNELFCN